MQRFGLTDMILMSVMKGIVFCYNACNLHRLSPPFPMMFIDMVFSSIVMETAVMCKAYLPVIMRPSWIITVGSIA